MKIAPDYYISEYTKSDAMKEALRQTEMKLVAQLSIATSSDQRAYAFCAVVIVLAALVLDSSARVTTQYIQLLIILHFFAAGVLAAYSARPTRFFDSGGTSAAFENYLGDGREGYVLSALIERNDELIKRNDRAIKRASRQFLLALLFGGTGLILALGDPLANVQGELIGVFK